MLFVFETGYRSGQILLGQVSSGKRIPDKPPKQAPLKLQAVSSHLEGPKRDLNIRDLLARDFAMNEIHFFQIVLQQVRLKNFLHG